MYTSSVETTVIGWLSVMALVVADVIKVPAVTVAVGPTFIFIIALTHWGSHDILPVPVPGFIGIEVPAALSPVLWNRIAKAFGNNLWLLDLL